MVMQTFFSMQKIAKRSIAGDLGKPATGTNQQGC